MKRRKKNARGVGMQGLRVTCGSGLGRQDSERRTGGGGRREWTPVQVDRRYKTGREGGESGDKISVLLSIRVTDGVYSGKVG